MFIAVILGYVLASVLAFCGLINLILFGCDLHQGMDIVVFMQKLMAGVWPLATSAILCLLVQIAQLLEKQNLIAASAPKPQQDKVYRKTHGHRNFGCAEESFSAPAEHNPHVVAGEARTFGSGARTHIPHPPTQPVAVAPTPAPQAPPHPSAGRQMPGRHVPPPVPTDNKPAINYSSASRAIQDIKPGSFFHMEPTPIPAAEPAPVAPPPIPPAAPQDETQTAEPQAEATQEKEPQPVPPPLPTDPGLSFFRTN